jgi:hypothetical protein
MTVAEILSNFGFSAVKIRRKNYTNKLGNFVIYRILLQSKCNAILFSKLIPLQHYRKQQEIKEKIHDFESVKGRARPCFTAA